MKGKKNKVMEFHGSDKKCNFFGTLLCKNVNNIPNKNKILLKKLRKGKLAKTQRFKI